MRFGIRHIPSLKTLRSYFERQFEHEYGDESILKLKALRQTLEGWRDGGISSRSMLEAADGYLRGHGVESIENASGDTVAYYVNMGDAYNGTLLLDLKRRRVWATTWGDWLEAEERQGARFNGVEGVEEHPKARKIADAMMKRSPKPRPFELAKEFNITRDQAEWIVDADLVAFGPGGLGYEWMVKKVSRILG